MRSFLRDLTEAWVLLWRQPDTLSQDVRFAIRGLLRQPGFTFAVIILLAVAIGANVAMFSAFLFLDSLLVPCVNAFSADPCLHDA